MFLISILSATLSFFLPYQFQTNFNLLSVWFFIFLPNYSIPSPPVSPSPSSGFFSPLIDFWLHAADASAAVRGGPASPLAVTVSDVNKDYVFLTWQPPSADGASPVEGYYVERWGLTLVTAYISEFFSNTNILFNSHEWCGTVWFEIEKIAQSAFFITATKQWNVIPTNIRESSSLNEFKNKAKNLLSLRLSNVFLVCSTVDFINIVTVYHFYCYYCHHSIVIHVLLMCIAQPGTTDENEHFCYIWSNIFIVHCPCLK